VSVDDPCVFRGRAFSFQSSRHFLTGNRYRYSRREDGSYLGRRHGERRALKHALFKANSSDNADVSDREVLINDQWLISGGQPPAEFENTLRQIAKRSGWTSPNLNSVGCRKRVAAAT
jgi:hypothetical protein